MSFMINTMYPLNIERSRMGKIGFEMSDEERALNILDTVLDVSIAQIVEGFSESVLTSDERQKLEELLIDANGITSKALEKYKRKE